jgi:sporulation protein YlmC with PRC-barrel domain
MRLPLLLCVTSLVATAALAQRESSPSSSPSSPSSSSSQSGVSGQSGQSSSIYSATGRGAGYAGQQQHLRSTKVIGAPVKTSSGDDVGRIEDVILNPTSGRIDFAVISTESKLCPVPWQLLSLSGQGGQSQSSFQRGTSSSTSPSTSANTSSSTSPSSKSSTSPTTPSSPSSSSGTSPSSSSSGLYASSSSSMGQPAFILNVDKEKLQQGPSFDRSRWPELSASWSQRIYSHYGVQAETGVGGTGAGSIKSSSSDQGSTGNSTGSGSGKSSSNSDSSSSGKSTK